MSLSVCLSVWRCVKGARSFKPWFWKKKNHLKKKIYSNLFCLLPDLDWTVFRKKTKKEEEEEEEHAGRPVPAELRRSTGK